MRPDCGSRATRVLEAIADGVGHGGVFYRIIVSLHIGLGQAGLIKIVGRGRDQVGPFSLIDTLAHNLGIEYHIGKKIKRWLALIKHPYRLGNLGHLLGKPFAREAGVNLSIE